MIPSRRFGIGVDIALYVLLPALGILAWGWDWRPVVVLFWLDNITIGVLTLISLVRRRRAGEVPSSMHPLFFALHYGIFTTVHGVFVFIIVMGAQSFSAGIGPAAEAEPLPLVPILIAWGAASLVQWALAAFSKTPFTDGVGGAYGRVVVLHLTILLGVFLIITLQLPAIVAIVLVVLRALAEALIMGRRAAGAAAGSARSSSGWTFEQSSPGRWELRRVMRVQPRAAPRRAEPASPPALPPAD
ncbi:DUF6498-containing protein [Salinibacterium sp. ZJ77]|uniref:DUF6498-containing protein n=1 Tax=Salinibacterium sp. ZJ77 TaxID=2708337 RepID=UPI00142487AD|nr:DUF6498-containing protein [Salinibacterium sp. ZJ77]